MVKISKTFGMAAIVALAAMSAWADDGVGRIEDGVAKANARVGAPPTLIDPDFKLDSTTSHSNSAWNRALARLHRLGGRLS